MERAAAYQIARLAIWSIEQGHGRPIPAVQLILQLLHLRSRQRPFAVVANSAPRRVP